MRVLLVFLPSIVRRGEELICKGGVDFAGRRLGLCLVPEAGPGESPFLRGDLHPETWVTRPYKL